MSEQQAMPVEQEATSLGWVPLDKFRGDPEKWVPAETFVERGHQVMPILKKNNERLLTELAGTKNEAAQLRAALNETQQSVKDLVAFQSAEVKRRVEAEVASLRAEKTAAIKDGDHDLAATLDEALDVARDKLKAPPPAAPAPAPATTPTTQPWAQEFAADNPWLGSDKRKTALFMGICEELRPTGLHSRALLDKAKSEMEATFAPPPGPGKEEGHRGGGGGGGGGATGGKSFKDLPPDAQAQCKSDSRKFVGAHKAFKDEAAWQKHYATTYFEE